MTIETTTNRVSYTGSGTTGPFSVPFYFLEDDDLTVIKTTIADGTEATLVLTTDYTVSGAGVEAGGSVTLVATLSSSYKLTIIRNPDLLQDADYPPNDRFPAATHEQALDKLTMISQRLKDLIDRSFRLSDGDTSGISLILSNLAAGNLIAVNSAGDGIESIAAADVDLATVSAFILTLLDDANAATARTTLGAAALGANTFTGLQTQAASADIASATTIDLTAATGNVTRITGTTATSAFTMNKGQWHICIADGAWPLTYHATTNKLATGGANHTCAAGDRLLLVKDDDDIIQGVVFKQDGTAVVSSGVTTLTPIATTSGSSQTHSSLPAGIKHAVVSVRGVSSNGTAVIGIQLGDSGGLETTGYAGCVNNFNGAALASLSTSFALSTSGAAAQVLEGVMDLVLVDSSTNTWNATWIMSRSDGTTGVYTGSGSVSLSGTLDRVAIVTSDTLDAGKFGLTYTV